MVDWNKVKSTGMQWGDKTKEKFNDANELRKKSAQETKLTLKGSMSSTAVRKDINGDYYLSTMYSETEPRFAFENIEFAGSTITERTIGDIKKQGRSGSALVGGLLAGGVGAVAGASRKKKSKVNTKTTAEEKAGKGKVHLRSLDSHEIKTIKFKATSAEFDNIVRFFS